MAAKENRNAGFPRELPHITNRTPCVPTRFHETAMKTHLDDLRPRNTQVHRREPSRAAQDALLRLARNPQDACALVAVYEACGNRLKGTAVRWFGKDPEIRAKVINTILAAISRKAPDYDPESMDAAQWVRKCADTEARRLREALDSTGLHTGRPM